MYYRRSTVWESAETGKDKIEAISELWFISALRFISTTGHTIQHGFKNKRNDLHVMSDNSINQAVW